MPLDLPCFQRLIQGCCFRDASSVNLWLILQNAGNVVQPQVFVTQRCTEVYTEYHGEILCGFSCLPLCKKKLSRSILIPRFPRFPDSPISFNHYGHKEIHKPHKDIGSLMKHFLPCDPCASFVTLVVINVFFQLNPGQ